MLLNSKDAKERGECSAVSPKGDTLTPLDRKPTETCSKDSGEKDVTLYNRAPRPFTQHEKTHQRRLSNEGRTGPPDLTKERGYLIKGGE